MGTISGSVSLFENTVNLGEPPLTWYCEVLTVPLEVSVVHVLSLATVSVLVGPAMHIVLVCSTHLAAPDLAFDCVIVNACLYHRHDWASL